MVTQPPAVKRSAADIDRRTVFSALAAAGAASLVAPSTSAAQQPNTSRETETPGSTPSGTLPPRTAPSASAPSARQIAADQQAPPQEQLFVARSGSDRMVDAIKQLNIDYVATMPGSSFRGLHESIINYGGNKQPELLTCLHEEISVAMGHGYYKIAGRPMAALLHGVVGVQHAAMAIYNAWADRVPVVLLAGNNLDATKRRPGAEWNHSALDNAAIVRDYTKWDAQPASLEHFDEALFRAYAFAVTPPGGPVLLMVDTELQERPIPAESRPTTRLSVPAHPVGDPGAIAEAARLLVGAQNPVIVADILVRSQKGMEHLVELAEALQAPVIDRYSRLNMPTDHYLNQSGRERSLIRQADVILGLELSDFFGVVNSFFDKVDRFSRSLTSPGVKLIAIGSRPSLIKSNFQDFQRYEPVDISIIGDGEMTLPHLIEAVNRRLPSDRSSLDERGNKLRHARKSEFDRDVTEASYGWNATPISVARLCTEIWPLIRDSDWALVGSDSQFRNYWPQKLWTFTKAYQYSGGSGGAGVGYGAPSAVGSALAHREHGRLVVNIQGDGDLMCCTGALWTAVHHKIPLLTVMHNNRAYHQELMHVQRMADRHERGITRAHIGTVIDDPPIDYAKLAQSMGMWGAGPVTDPSELGPALQKAVDVVKRGEPALVDVVAQGR